MRKEKKYHFIYKTTNLLSGRYYIGMHSTDNLNDGYLGSGVYITRAIKKHGNTNFKREIIKFCVSREELKAQEESIVTLQEVANQECMNLKVGGQGIRTDIITDEIREKISNGLKGHKTSDETKRKISESLKGYKFTDERIQNIRRGRAGQPGLFKGKTHSKETKQKMSDAQKGVSKPKVKCPHCEKIGGYQQMRQWHFDKCKLMIKNIK